MASTPFFGKRESPVLPTRPSPHASLTGDAPAAATASDSPPVAPPVEGAPLSPVAEASVAVPGGSKLIVSPNIKLKGVEITDCDTLVVEGLVEATMDARQPAETRAGRPAPATAATSRRRAPGRPQYPRRS